MGGCRRCGAVNSPEAVFCMKCGVRLTGRLRSEARKPVTILFNDVADSTALAERLEPESLRRVMWRYFETVAEVCERHGGTVEKFIGDAAMAVFGIPVTLEDHALRAVRAAAELDEELERLGDELERDWDVRLRTRTGLNSGEVVAGDPAGGQALVTGDPVNVAARLQQSAEPGQILIGEATRQLVGGAVRVIEVEPLLVKGKQEPLVAWTLAEVTSKSGQPARRTGGPMLGRDGELRTLRRTFEQVARERVPARVTVIGPAGIGKSRLAHELRAGLAERADVYVGNCLPYGEGITFWPLAEIVHQAAGDDVRAGLQALLAGERHGKQITERVMQAVGLAEGSASGADLTWAIRVLFETLARRRSVVLVFEDIHWAEPPLLELIEHLSERPRESPLMLLCLARRELLERRPGWEGQTARSATIQLEPLSEDDTRALIDELVSEGDFTRAARTELVERAAGNPLFVEQMLALVREGGGHGGAVSIPPTIQALLAARLDQLTEEETAVVGAAAVVGREFWADAVATLQDLPPAAGAPSSGAGAAGGPLDALVRRELIGPATSAVGGDDGYAFRHALIRDAAYESLTKGTRAQLHERFAGWMEDRHGARLIEFEAILGYHLEQAHGYRTELAPADDHARDLARRGAEHLASAGRRAARAREDATAAGLLTRASALLGAGDPGRRRLLPLLAESLEGTANHTQAGEIYEQALQQALSAGDPWVEGRARLGRAHVWFVADPEITVDRIVEETTRAIALLEQEGDPQGTAEALRLTGEARMYDGRAGEGQQALERALALLDLDRFPRTWNAVSFALGMCMLDGPAPLDRAIEFAIERLDEARARGLRSLEADMLHVLGAGEGRRARFDNGREALRASAEISEELGLRYMAQWCKRTLGRLELAAGDPEAAETALLKSHMVIREMGLNGSLAETVVSLADALLRQGRLAEAEELLDGVRDEWASGDASVDAPRLAVRAKLLAAQGWDAHAGQTADRAMRLVRRTDWACLQADTMVAQAEVLRLVGQEDAAAGALREALAISDRKGYGAGAAEAQAALERLGARARPAG